MLSYWEQQSFLYYDVAVIGGGITGLSTAISVKENEPSLNVAILERGLIPAGASTRNAGFACIGSFTEILDDLERSSEEQVLQLIQMRRNGLKLLRKRLGDEAIEYYEKGSYELIGEKEFSFLDQLDKINKMLYPVLACNAFSLNNEKIISFGFNKDKVKTLVQNHCEGELNAGKMMRSLIGKALQLGIEIKTGCEVKALEENENYVEIKTANTSSSEIVSLRARIVAVCTNAFTKELFPDIDLTPGRGQVLITEPVSNLPFLGIFHFDKGYYYFREIAGRVLFGGGRTLDFAGETTTNTGLNDRIQQDLEQKLKTIILPGIQVRIAQRWSGIMAFGKNKFPIRKRYSDRIFIGVRMGGMGIAIGSEVGWRLANMILDR